MSLTKSKLCTSELNMFQTLKMNSVLFITNI